MAKDKKSFVLYADLIGRVDHLTNEEKGVLFQHLLEYVNDLNPVLEDRILIGVWKPIEQQLKRDLKKFEQVKVKRSVAGKRSAELRALKKDKQTSTNPTSVKSVEQTSTNPTVNDNVNVSVSDNDINNNKLLFKKDLEKDNYYLEQVCITKKIKPNLMQKYINDFNLGYANDSYPNFSEYKKHFFRWLNLQDNTKFETKKYKPIL